MSVAPFDHLLLLIGTNPIPNYVVARYLLGQAYAAKRTPTLHLIHTGQTKEVANRLYDALDKHFKKNGHAGKLVVNDTVKFHHLHDAYAPSVVQEDMQTAIHAMTGNVHLNHTGGTKSMAVESALAASGKFNARLTRSYLNPSKFTLDIGDASYPETDDMRQEVKMSLKDLIDLHNSTLFADDKAVWPDTAAALRTFALKLNGDKMDKFLEWKSGLVSHRGIREARTKIQFQAACNQWAASQRNQLQWHTDPDFAPVRDAWAGEAAYIIQNAPFQWGDSSDRLREKIASQFVHYLRGGWLESLICDSAERLNFWNETRANCEVRHEGAQKHRQMELDVLAIKGYSLTLFSCTTSKSIKDIKLKAFEAFHRAQQLGGEEALAVMVCLARKDELRNLYVDLQTDHGGRPPLKFISWEGLRALDDSMRGIAQHQKDRGENEVTVF